MNSKASIIALGFLLAVTTSTAAQVDETLQDPQAPPGRRGPTCLQAQDYVPGTVAAGEFTVTDCFTIDGGIREPVDYWRIRVAQRTDLHLVVESPGIPVQLRLLTDDGVEVKTDEFVNPFTFLSTQVAAGTYRVEVQSRGAPPLGDRLFGRYTLRSSTDQIGFEGCPTLTPLPTIGTVQGEWTVEDCLLPTMLRYDLRHHDYYLLKVSARRDLALELDSPDVSATLALFTRDGAPVADDVGTTARIVTQLTPGDYVVRVGVAPGSERETGRYVLHVR